MHTETSAILIIDVSLSLTRPLTIFFHFAHINENVTYAHLLASKTDLVGDDGMSYWLFNRERAGEFANYNKLLYDGHMKSINADVVVVGRHTKTEFLINDDGELTF